MISKKRILFLAAASLLATAAYLASTQETSDPSLWLADFEKLQLEMAKGYANLEWAAERRHLDLPELRQETESRLRNTSSRGRARRIVTDFLDQFADPHLRAEPAEPPSGSDSPVEPWSGPTSASAAKEALRRFGYSKASSSFGLNFKALAGFEELAASDNPFPAGILTLPDGRQLGVIRIQYFGEDRYYDTAEATWEDYRQSLKGSCDGRCWWQFTLAVRTNLLLQLKARVAQLKKQGVDALLVDITGNGGGSEWCEDVARLFTAKRLRLPVGRFVKHPHWEREMEREIGWMEEDLARTDLPPELRVLLEQSLTRHRALLDEVRLGCDASALWNGNDLDCRRLVTDTHGEFQTSAATKMSAATLAAEHVLFPSIRHPDLVGVYDGPLFVALDGGTASASEQFATMLQANSAATLIGEASYGAGCGYTRGGIPVFLEHLKLRVRMPDCMRTRADGENELAGVLPDLAGWDEGARSKDRARGVMNVVRGISPWKPGNAAESTTARR